MLGYRSDAADVMAALDVAVSSSAFEGSPLAVMEYMESARPIVATRVGGVPDLIEDGVHGLLVEAGRRPAPWRPRSGACWPTREAARRMGEAARERRRHEFTVELMVRRFEALYERLVAGDGPPESAEQLDALKRHEPGECRAREDGWMSVCLSGRTVRQPAQPEARGPAAAHRPPPARRGRHR